MHGKYLLLKALLPITIALSSSPTSASVTVSDADSAIKKYCEAIINAKSISDIRKHWTNRFTLQNDELEIKQRSTFSPEVRALIEAKSLNVLKEMARTFPSKMKVVCDNKSCVATALLMSENTSSAPGQSQSFEWLQTITVKLDNEQALIDDAVTALSSKSTSTLKGRDKAKN
jgi:hypothetical protein